MKNAKCLVCNNDAKVDDAINYDGEFYTCPKCGKYIVEITFQQLMGMNNPFHNHACLYYYVTQIQKNRQAGTILHFFGTEDWDEGYVKNYHFISFKSIVGIFPENIGKKIDKTIVNIGNILRYLGNDFIMDFTATTYNEIKEKKELERLCYMFWVDDKFGENTIFEQIREMLNILEEAGYIKITLDGGMQKRYTLTTEGWLLYHKLEKASQSNKQAFIAMWFDDNMQIAKKKIIEAIRDSGYLPVIINEKEYNDFIVPEILHEIRKSDFVVADFTGDRGGVYYEAGYARGLEKPVIMTCRHKDFDVHFDTKQISHILWDNEDDLYSKLMKRIEATVGQA